MHVYFVDDVSNGCRIPLAFDNGAGLGIVTKDYLRRLKDPSEITNELKAQIKAQEIPPKVFEYVKDGSLTKSLDLVWTMWEAVNAGVQAADKDVKEQKFFQEVDNWLAPRK